MIPRNHRVFWVAQKVDDLALVDHALWQKWAAVVPFDVARCVCPNAFELLQMYLELEVTLLNNRML